MKRKEIAAGFRKRLESQAHNLKVDVGGSFAGFDGLNRSRVPSERCILDNS